MFPVFLFLLVDGTLVGQVKFNASCSMDSVTSFNSDNERKGKAFNQGPRNAAFLSNSSRSSGYRVLRSASVLDFIFNLNRVSLDVPTIGVNLKAYEQLIVMSTFLFTWPQ